MKLTKRKDIIKHFINSIMFRVQGGKLYVYFSCVHLSVLIACFFLPRILNMNSANAIGLIQAKHFTKRKKSPNSTIFIP